MIECTSCRLPTSPLILFWEGVLRTKCPCICGASERSDEVWAKAFAPAVRIMDNDVYAEDRASDEGMAIASVAIAIRRPVPAINYAEELASDEGMSERGAVMAPAPVIMKSITIEIDDEARASDEGMAERDFEYKVVSIRRGRKYKSLAEIRQDHTERQRELDAKFQKWLGSLEQGQLRHQPRQVRPLTGKKIVLKEAFEQPAQQPEPMAIQGVPSLGF